MFRKLVWKIALPPEQTLARMEESLVHESAMKGIGSDFLNDSLMEWREKDQLLGRVKGNTFRMFFPREVMRNAMAPILRGRVEADGAGSRVVARVGWTVSSLVILAILVCVWAIFAIPWMNVQHNANGLSWGDAIFGGFFNIFTIPVYFILVVLRLFGLTDQRTYNIYFDTNFHHEIEEANSESKTM
jgi:hypothetical protein